MGTNKRQSDLYVFTYYLIKKWQELGKLKGNEYVVKTIVTTELIKDIARKANVELYDCYTGFKWIAAIMRENEGKRYISAEAKRATAI